MADKRIVTTHEASNSEVNTPKLPWKEALAELKRSNMFLVRMALFTAVFTYLCPFLYTLASVSPERVAHPLGYIIMTLVAHVSWSLVYITKKFGLWLVSKGAIRNIWIVFVTMAVIGLTGFIAMMAVMLTMGTITIG